MKIKLFSLLAFLLVHAGTAMAQDKTKFAVLGGVNFQNINGKDASGGKLDNKILTGFHVGVNVAIPVAPEFYFQPGLLYSTKGANISNNAITGRYKLSYVEMPLNFVYKGALGDGFVMLGFGPYLGYGIGGKVVTGSVEKKIQFKNSVVAADSAQNIPYARAFDAGANIFFGYEMASGLFFQLNTQLGMLKINPENKMTSDDKTSMKHTGFGLSAGFRF